MIDPIADMLTRIRNASRALLPTVVIPHSRLKESLAHILKQEGYISEVAIDTTFPKTIKVRLKYEGKKSVVEGLKRVSKPGLRHYKGVGEMQPVLNGLGITILTTSKGVLSSREAKAQNVGGEVLCEVW